MILFFQKRNQGFTLIELLVVIAIIGVLSTLAIVALGNARLKSRDSKRMADLKQISTALELYYSDNGCYPDEITPGESIASPEGTGTYLQKIPSNPEPRTDGGCSGSDYSYVNLGNTYYIFSCIGNDAPQLPAGEIAYGSEIGFTSGCGNVTDVDGNVYSTVVIGSQCWMKENLKTGVTIDSENDQIVDLTSDPIYIDKYCPNGDDETNTCPPYGGLYQWHTAMGFSTDDDCDHENCDYIINDPHQGICPIGWHIPSAADFTTLNEYLLIDGNGGAGNGLDVGGKLKEAGVGHWSEETCDDGDSPTAVCNSTHFTALPAGYCDNDGSFYETGDSATFWLADQGDNSSTNGYAIGLSADNSTIIPYTNYYKTSGFSVRCLKDE